MKHEKIGVILNFFNFPILFFYENILSSFILYYYAKKYVNFGA